MKSKGKIIRNKILYTLFNDVALFGLLLLTCSVSSVIPYYPTIWKILFMFAIIVILLFYLLRSLTTAGDLYDSEDDDTFFVILKVIFFGINIFGFSVFFAGRVVAIILLGVNTILISGTQYFRILLLLHGKYQLCDVKILSVEKHRKYLGKGISEFFYVARIKHDIGGTDSICIDRYTFIRIQAKEATKARLVIYPFPKGRTYYELIPVD
ncbi:MAG: hypothetical protein SPL61_06995 [Saccharofermentans sp.]|nr:hypothetical protein [Saccharofermentans sp.]